MSLNELLNPNNILAPNWCNIYANSVTTNTLTVINSETGSTGSSLNIDCDNLIANNALIRSYTGYTFYAATGNIANFSSSNSIISSLTGTLVNAVTLVAGTGVISSLTSTNAIISSLTGGLINVGSTLLLPTSGGTKSNLNYYEEYHAGYNATGCTSESFILSITKIGNLCVCYFPQVTFLAESTGFFSFSGIPSRFYPLNSEIIPIHSFCTYVDGMGDTISGLWRIGTGGGDPGHMDISSSINTGNFSSGTTYTINSATTSWITL